MDKAPCTYRISIKAVARDADNRILLILGSDGTWELPGGGLEHGEDPKTGLTREIREETGFSTVWISDHPEVFWAIQKEVKSIPELKWFAFVAYRVKLVGNFKPGISGGDEGLDAKYFSDNEAKQLNLHANTQPYFFRPRQGLA